MAGIEPVVVCLEGSGSTIELHPRKENWMTTDEKEIKAAAEQLMDGVKLMNKSLNELGRLGVYVKLDDHHEFGKRNPTYLVSTMEKRESVVPLLGRS